MAARQGNAQEWTQTDAARNAEATDRNRKGHRGISTAKYPNHAKENADERGFAGLTAGDRERNMTSFL
jgi:hypothetical protein